MEPRDVGSLEARPSQAERLAGVREWEVFAGGMSRVSGRRLYQLGRKNSGLVNRFKSAKGIRVEIS